MKTEQQLNQLNYQYIVKYCQSKTLVYFQADEINVSLLSSNTKRFIIILPAARWALC